MKKKYAAVALSAILAGSACAFTACDTGDKSEKLAYVSMDINPAIELIVDKDNNVVSVRGENEDGQVLLYNETGIVGVKVDAAVNKITDLAVKYGYINENNKVVDTIVTSGDDKFAADILGKVNTSITATAENLGVTVTTDGEGAYSLLRKLDEYKKKFPDNKAIQNLSVSKFKLALSVSETGEISLDAAVKLDDGELVKMLKDVSPRIEAYATQEYNKAKTEALAAYEQATEIAGYSAYASYYMNRLLTHRATAYYGGTYCMYASAAVGLSVICDVAELAAKIDNYPLDEANVQAVITALGGNVSVDELKDSDENVTVDSIYAYADKAFKNTPASEELENTKKALNEALTKAESVLKKEADKVIETYKPQIEAAVNSAKSILSAIQNDLTAYLPTVKTILDKCTEDLNEVITELERVIDNGTLDLDGLRKAANRLEDKADEYLAKIKADLTEEEWAELQAKQAAEIAKFTEAKNAFEKAVDDAAKAAKDYLEAKKAERMPQT